MNKNYIEHSDKVVETDGRFKHVMAIALNPKNTQEGVIRCIISRQGDVEIKGYVDRSELHRVVGSSLDRFDIGQRFMMRGESSIMSKIVGEGWDFIGLEDPDIWQDESTGLLHMYFTIPIKSNTGKKDGDYSRMRIHLGHAAGASLDTMEMTMPVLLDTDGSKHAKEVSIAPLNSKGVRYNLVESNSHIGDIHYSTVIVAIAKDMGKDWEYGPIAFHPAEHKISWIGGHASPGPLFPKSFLDIGAGKAVGIMNGREADQKVGEQTKYGMFSVGLFIYDYENGKIDWVSPEPFIQDSEAKTITFASQFIETRGGEGTLYAHVDDSFVRAYTLNTEAVRSLLPDTYSGPKQNE